MSATPATFADEAAELRPLSRGRVGMWCLITAESAIFLIFVIAYLVYMGTSLDGPTPKQILTVPVITTICLLSSSATMHWATSALRRGKLALFRLFWFVTLMLGTIFLVGTGREWHRFIYQENFTIHTNLFGTTFYSLVGLHASHVAVGLIALATVMILALFGKVKQEHSERCEILAMYWHFVDAVWVVVFTVVYGLGR
ncbi:MAG: heme-copper oxidase subunit III [Acidobacteriota bacterium]|nr:heme-copper oxidase subunit III [Acidobacteriota bacterium]MDE3169821.1 heme-copper oxidase subunit III [Acidobacteriota bacterium]